MGSLYITLPGKKPQRGFPTTGKHMVKIRRCVLQITSFSNIWRRPLYITVLQLQLHQMHKFRCIKLQIFQSSKMHKHFKDSYNSLFFNNFNNLKSFFGLVRWNHMIIHEYDIYLIEEQSSLKYLVSDFRFQNVSYVFFNFFKF